jgi:exocyst complex component 5
LHFILGRKYVSTGLQLALEDMSGYDSKSTPAVGHLSLVQISNQIIQAFQLHVQSCEMQILASSVTSHRDMILSKNDFISSVESQLNQLVQKRINSILDWIQTIFSKQKKSDYNLKDGLLENTMNTSTCNQISDYFRFVIAEAYDSLDEQNRESYFTEIGSCFCK